MARSLLLPASIALAAVYVLVLGPAFVTGPTKPLPTKASGSFGRAKSRVARHASTAKLGIFSPIVEGAKQVLGPKELNTLRGEVIKAHSKVIANMVETSDSKFGRIVLKKLFEAADKDGNGTLDKAEVRSCLLALGFDWMDKEPKIEGMINKGDLNGDEVIDFEEFTQMAPLALRQNLVKLAKKNGNDLGFLV
eukprot:TRINITY_DN2934_c0_g5_i1.p2 TRINITY_DN2934_c0_g5~~TRINITY_DN2934_c0_g5_i1.p2  ORF type:complete len:193 (+),score=34.43 TRINITY_DN2934_c0_g5_i1:78-656(+)